MKFGGVDPMMMDDSQLRAWNEYVVGKVMEGTPDSIKEAEMTMDEYIRPFNREMEFCNQIITPKPHDESENVPSTEHDHPQIMIEIEPASPGAMVVDFGYAPNNFYPYGKRLTVAYQMQQTERVIKQIIELSNYKYRFRQAITDLASLQLAAQRDARFMRGAKRMLSGENTNLPWSGKPNNRNFAANIDYNSWLRFLDIPQEHVNKLATATVLINTLSMKYLKAFIAQTFTGTELAADVWRKSFEVIMSTNDNIKIVATIKDSLVEPNEYYGFAAENRLGRYSVYQEPTMVVKNEGTHISFYQWKLC